MEQLIKLKKKYRTFGTAGWKASYAKELGRRGDCSKSPSIQSQYVKWYQSRGINVSTELDS